MAPSIFQNLELDAALVKSSEEGSYLLVDATAVWCGPCKKMDELTWVDPNVVERLAGAALCIQIDVDEQADVAKRLRIRSMPTVVAFRDGIEVDRVFGLQRPEQLLRWFEGVVRGETVLGQHRSKVRDNPEDVDLRYDLARLLVSQALFEEATEEFTWVWERMRDVPEMTGVRHSFLKTDMERLAASNSSARNRFQELRDAAAPRPGATLEQGSLMEWLTLNAVLKEEETVIEWFDSAREAWMSDEAARELVESRVVPLLVARDRWSDVGAAYANPVASFERAAKMRADMKDPKADPGLSVPLSEYADRGFRQTANWLVRGLRAAGRDDEAARIEARAREVDPSVEMATALSIPTS